MTDDIRLYTNPLSRGRTARWMLEEVGCPYQAIILEYGCMKGPDFLAINPMGKVPALTHGAVVVTETAAICSYLADAFPAAALAPPPGSPARAAYYRWLFFAAGPVEAAITNKTLGVAVPAGRERMAGYGTFADTMDVLEGAVSAADYLAGGAFSAADLYLGSQIGFGMQFGMVEPRPAFERYWERLMQRPAAIKAREADDALLPPGP